MLYRVQIGAMKKNSDLCISHLYEIKDVLMNARSIEEAINFVIIDMITDGHKKEELTLIDAYREIEEVNDRVE